MYNTYDLDTFDGLECSSVWKGLLSNFPDTELHNLRKSVYVWNSKCNSNDRLVIKLDAYDCKGRLLNYCIALYREDITRYSDLSEFWNEYRAERDRKFY